MNKHECFIWFFTNKGEVWNYAFVSVLKIGERKLKIVELRIEKKRIEVQKVNILFSILN